MTIYLDYNATTPVDPSVLKAMLPYFVSRFGNPSSSHRYGQDAKNAVEESREKVANLISADAGEIVFTSGGTESDNYAIIGLALAARRGRPEGRDIITSEVEHPAVLETCGYLHERFGFKVTYLPVDHYGSVNPEDLRQALTDGTILITIMHANNEVGTIEPLEEIGQIAREHGVPFHTDAAQSCGKIPVDVNKLKADLLTIAGHKMYAPKGIGALYVRKGVKLDSYIRGAGQEMGMRAGTENVPYIVGLGAACEKAKRTLPSFGIRVAALRDRLFAGISEGVGGGRVRLNGHPLQRLPNTLNISIRGTVGETLLGRIPELAASTGSACHSGTLEPSKVLLAMGLDESTARGALRLSLGRWTDKEDIDRASRLITGEAARYTAS